MSKTSSDLRLDLDKDDDYLPSFGINDPIPVDEDEEEDGDRQEEQNYSWGTRLRIAFRLMCLQMCSVHEYSKSRSQ